MIYWKSHAFQGSRRNSFCRPIYYTQKIIIHSLWCVTWDRGSSTWLLKGSPLQVKYLSVFVISTSVRIETLLILHQKTYLSSSRSSIQGSLNIWNLMFVLTPGFVSIWVEVSVKYFIIPCKCRVYRSFIYRITDLHMPQMSMFCSLRIERHNHAQERVVSLCSLFKAIKGWRSGHKLDIGNRNQSRL